MPDPPATTTTVSLKQKLDGARELRELILRHRDYTDEARQLAQPVVESMARLGLFRALVPASAGGEEWAWPTWLQVVEELSTVDGAVGWNAGVGSTANAIVSGWVFADVGRTVFCQDPIGLIAGAGAPTGTHDPSTGATASPAGGSLPAGVLMPAGSSRAMWWRARRRGWGR
jgi:indole-3-acetate monooxygenase